MENTNLGVINYPDSSAQACAFIPFSFSLGNSARTRWGLPNMPNYNLGATSIYQADAGIDTFYCIGDTIKAVGIGLKDTIPGVTYTWLNEVDSIQQHRPYALVKPEQSTWYYLELSDTSIQGSCTRRIDSVFVEVRNCTGLNEYLFKNVKVYPNPVNSLLHIETTTPGGAISLYNLLGGEALTASLTETHTILDISMIPTGVYMYRITQNGQSVYGKVVVE